MKPITCAKCNQEIPEGDLVECPYCWEAYHTECWLETANCLNCKKFNMDFARVRAEKERAEAEAKAKAKKELEESEFSEAEMDDESDSPVRFSSSSMSDSVASVSKIVLIVSIVFGVLFAIYMFISIGVAGIVIGAVSGAGLVACGWILSVLINGFAELINNSHKTVEYLAELTAKNNSKEK